VELEIGSNTKQRKINELEQWILCLSSSTLVAAGSEKDAKSLEQQINFCIDRMDKLMEENFHLKKEIAYEKKRYLDLMNAFIELRGQIKQEQLDKQGDGDQLVREKNQLQLTL
jgi:predicted  nucleic acid-binding Zn-ribbon protein